MFWEKSFEFDVLEISKAFLWLSIVWIQSDLSSKELVFGWLNVSQSLASHTQDFVRRLLNLPSRALLHNQWILSSLVKNLLIDQSWRLEGNTWLVLGVYLIWIIWQLTHSRDGHYVVNRDILSGLNLVMASPGLRVLLQLLLLLLLPMSDLAKSIAVIDLFVHVRAKNSIDKHSV